MRRLGPPRRTDDQSRKPGRSLCSQPRPKIGLSQAWVNGLALVHTRFTRDSES